MRKGPRGFTLVEILVVLGIIALLAAILLPAFARVRANARSASCSSNLKQLGVATALYIQDYDYFPLGIDPSDKYNPQIWGALAPQVDSYPLLNVVLDPYLKSEQVWQCPSDVGFTFCDIDSQLLNAVPTSYQAFGMSYYYHTALAIPMYHVPIEQLPDPANTNLLNDGCGDWHGGGFAGLLTTKRYNMLYADMHVKNIDYNTFLAAWAVPL